MSRTRTSAAGTRLASEIKLDWHQLKKLQSSKGTAVENLKSKYATLFDRSVGMAKGLQPN